MAFGENPDTDHDGCQTAGKGRCVLYLGSAVATQGSGNDIYTAYVISKAGNESHFSACIAFETFLFTFFNKITHVFQ